MNMGELHVELHRRSLRMGNSQKYQTSGVHDARHLISWTDRSAIRVREHPDTATCLAARFFHLAKANTNTPAKCQLYVRSHAHGEMPTLRAITRTRRNATPFALSRNRFPGPGCIWTLGLYPPLPFLWRRPRALLHKKLPLCHVRDARTLLLYIVCAGFAPCGKTAYN